MAQRTADFGDGPARDSRTGDRRLAAVWFADIAGFTGLSARDEDAAMRLVEIFQEVTRNAVRRRGGTVIKFLGDGGLAVFPSADAAVRAGLAVRRDFESSAVAEGRPARLRIGIHVGEVVSKPDGDVYGDGVNTAARIQHEAEPGQVVISEDVRRQIRQRAAFALEPLGERTLRGLDEPIRLCAVVSGPDEGPDLAEPATSSTPRRSRYHVYVVAAALVTILLGLGWLGWRTLSERGKPSGGTETEPATADNSSIAVLPFTDLSPGRDQEYLGDGVTEELINALTRIDGLQVVSRTSAFAYKGQSLDVREIGRRLGVATVLEGSVRVGGEQLRITAHLVDVDDGFDLWSGAYDRRVEDVFAIQEEIARAIVAELEPELVAGSEPLVTQGTGDPEAYQLYLQGRYFWNQRTAESLAHAIELFEAALRADTTYALAYTGLADSYSQLRARGFGTAAQTLESERSAIEKALQLDPRLSEAHSSLAVLLFTRDWDWDAAGLEFEKAIELDPRNANARHAFSHYLVAMGRTPESLEQSRRAVEISPYDVIIRSHLGWHYLFARDYPHAAEELTRAVEMDPRDGRNYAFLARANEAQGKNDEAIDACQKARSLARQDAFAMGFVGFVYGRLGYEREALEVARSLEAMGDQTTYDMAVIHAGLGDTEGAIALLEKAYAKRAARTVYLNVDPRLDDLRSDSRFQALLRRMRLDEVRPA